MPLPFRIMPVREEEVLRRSALLDPSEEELELYRECRRDSEYLLEYRITERNRPLSVLTDDFLKMKIDGCDAVIIFTAFLGDAFEELVESRDEPEKDILYRGLAAERMDALIESYLDYKERVLAKEGAALTPHYPCRWEDVPENAFRTTRCVGVSFHPDERFESRCRSCFAENCPSRKAEAKTEG